MYTASKKIVNKKVVIWTMNMCVCLIEANAVDKNVRYGLELRAVNI
jgi:hypothetical protein